MKHLNTGWISQSPAAYRAAAILRTSSHVRLAMVSIPGLETAKYYAAAADIHKENGLFVLMLGMA
jgi:hypothetical protein